MPRTAAKTRPDQRVENAKLRAELRELQETLRAIREDSVDAFVIETAHGPQVFMLQEIAADSSLLRERILETIADAVVVYGDDERVVYLNAAARDRYGVTSNNALGGLIDGVFRVRWHHPDDAAQMAAALREGGRWRGRCLHTTRAGETLPVEVTVSRLDRSAGQAPLWLAAVHAVADSTTRATQAQLEKQARELRQWETIGALAAQVAADVSTMRESTTDAASRRAHELQQNLLAFQASRTSVRPLISVTPIVEQVARLLRVGLPEEIRIETSCGSPMPLIRAEATHLMRTLLILGINGVQAMAGRSGTLDIHATGITVTETMARAEPGLRSGRFVRIEVRDTGHGMDPETQLRAFEPYFTMKSAEQGTGLGLVLVRKFVESHQGIIVVHSAPEIGTAFELYLPCPD